MITCNCKKTYSSSRVFFHNEFCPPIHDKSILINVSIITHYKVMWIANGNIPAYS